MSIPLVERPRLVDELVAFTGRLVVISAPAGYGKSILAAQWLAADPRPGAWLSLDEADNDPNVLLTYLALAAGVSEGPFLDAEAGIDELLDLLTRVLATRTTGGILVLDDAHVISGDAAEVLTTLAVQVPAGSTLAVLTRDAPSFPATRGVLQGTVRRLGADDLAMTPTEAGALLEHSGIAEACDVVEALTDATEGWPAGLYLASLALREADDRMSAARGISGRQRMITDFFAEEVLPTIAPADLDFLLATAVLDRCCASLCDTVLDRTDTGAVLERLARTNRFVIPLDDLGEWYRYHHLFAEMLLGEARRRDRARVARVAARASQWWESRFEPDAAVTLALAADDRARAIELIARWSPFLQTDRRRVTVDRWLHAFDETEIFQTPALALTAAWNAALVGDAVAVQRFLRVVSQSPDEVPLPDGTQPIAAAAVLHALTTSEGLHALVTHAETAFASTAPQSPYRAAAAHLAAGGLLMLGDTERAEPYIEAAVAIGSAGLQPAQAQALANRARRDAYLGDLPAARRAVDEAIGIAEANWLTERPTVGFVFASSTLVHALVGIPTVAAEHRAQAVALLDRLEGMSPFHAACGYLECAESAVLTGDVDEATGLLGKAERRLRRLRDTGLLPFALARVGAAIARASGRTTTVLVERLSPAELRVLEYLPTHLSFGEIGEELFVSRNTVKSHAMAIYRKLGVTSRSAAVKEAGNFGLLDQGV